MSGQLRLPASHDRPGRGWFLGAGGVAVVAVGAAGFFPGYADESLPLIGDLLSVAAAVAFLFGAWHSIETRAALARLETTLEVSRDAAEAEQPDSPENSRRHADLAGIGKAMLSEELQRGLLGHIRLEWRAYIAGTVLLFDALALSVLGHLWR
jgi:hypothetical protein